MSALVQRFCVKFFYLVMMIIDRVKNDHHGNNKQEYASEFINTSDIIIFIEFEVPTHYKFNKKFPIRPVGFHNLLVTKVK